MGMVLKKFTTENFEIESCSTYYRIEVLGAGSVNPDFIYVDDDKMDEFIQLLQKAREELE
jgi:hypothetical protein